MVSYAFIACVSNLPTIASFNILLPGGTGPLGQTLIARFYEMSTTTTTPTTTTAASPPSTTTSSSLVGSPHHGYNVTILARNTFLASTPTRVSHDYGWVGSSFLQQYRSMVQLRDWDGGDLLDIVGQDWLGWQEETLPYADCIIHVTGGGYTPQRVMACERLVRESVRINPHALHITVNPTNELLAMMSPGMSAIKQSRIQACEDMVQHNVPNRLCLRIQDRTVDTACDQIVAALRDWETERHVATINKT
jgi:hypothetical protein